MLPKVLDLKQLDAGVVAQVVKRLPHVHSPKTYT